MQRESTSALPNATLVDVTSGFDGLLRRRLLDAMRTLDESELVVEDAAGSVCLGRPAAAPDATLRARLRVHDPAFYRAAALNGSVGAGESYMDGHWDCDDLFKYPVPQMAKAALRASANEPEASAFSAS